MQETIHISKDYFYSGIKECKDIVFINKIKFTTRTMRNHLKIIFLVLYMPIQN